jgi:hypothetical protein
MFCCCSPARLSISAMRRPIMRPISSTWRIKESRIDMLLFFIPFLQLSTPMPPGIEPETEGFFALCSKPRPLHSPLFLYEFLRYNVRRPLQTNQPNLSFELSLGSLSPAHCNLSCIRKLKQTNKKYDCKTNYDNTRNSVDPF